MSHSDPSFTKYEDTKYGDAFIIARRISDCALYVL